MKKAIAEEIKEDKRKEEEKQTKRSKELGSTVDQVA